MSQNEAYIVDLGREIYGQSPSIHQLAALSRRLKKFGCDVIGKPYPSTNKKAAYVTGLEALPENWKEILAEGKKLHISTKEVSTLPGTSFVEDVTVVKEPINFLERLALVLDRTLAKNEEITGENKLLWEENSTLRLENDNLKRQADELHTELQTLRVFKEAVTSEVPELSDRVTAALASED